MGKGQVEGELLNFGFVGMGVAGGRDQLVGREGGPKQISKLLILLLLDGLCIFHRTDVVFKNGLLILVKIFKKNLLYIFIVGLVLVLWQTEEQPLDREAVDVPIIRFLLARLVEEKMEILMPAAIHNYFKVISFDMTVKIKFLLAFDLSIPDHISPLVYYYHCFIFFYLHQLFLKEEIAFIQPPYHLHLGIINVLYELEPKVPQNEEKCF